MYNDIMLNMLLPDEGTAQEIKSGTIRVAF